MIVLSVPVRPSSGTTATLLNRLHFWPCEARAIGGVDVLPTPCTERPIDKVGRALGGLEFPHDARRLPRHPGISGRFRHPGLTNRTTPFNSSFEIRQIATTRKVLAYGRSPNIALSPLPPLPLEHTCSSAQMVNPTVELSPGNSQGRQSGSRLPDIRHSILM